MGCLLPSIGNVVLRSFQKGQGKGLQTVGGLHGIMTRPKYTTRRILLRSDTQVQIACAAVKNAPLDNDNPLLVTIGEAPKGRKSTQNEAMWAGVLRDIATQAWVERKQFSAEVWHEFFKKKYLPYEGELMQSELGELVKDPATYRKFDYGPDGERILVGSTTDLTVRGFALYMMQIEAEAASLGVQFSSRPE